MLLLSVPPAWVVSELVAGNPVGIPHLERLILMAGLVWAGLVSVMLLLRRVGVGRRAASYSVLLGGVLMVGGDPLTDQFGTAWAMVASIAVVGLAAWILDRHPSSELPNVLIFALAAALVAGPLASGYDSITSYGESSALPPEPITSRLATTPDIFLVVVDGFPGLQTLEADHGATYVAATATRFREAGFHVLDSAWSSYWTTKFSIPSMLNLGYPAETPSTDPATVQDMYDILSGDNVLADWLRSNGYQTHMVESGWSGSGCAAPTDICVPSHWLDESMIILGAKSIVGNLILENFGYSFTAGSEATMSWLLENAGRIAEDDRRSFVFGHLMAPHPPFFLDSDCSRVVEDDRSGLTFKRAGVADIDRTGYLEGQMDCVRSFLLNLSALVGDHALLMFLSDHGTDRRHQLVTDPETWEEPAIVERMNVFAAIRSPIECRIGDGLVIPNIVRRTISCLTVDAIPDVEAEMYLGPSTRLTGDEVENLISHGRSS